MCMKLRIYVLLTALIVFGFTTSTFAQSTTLSSGLVGHWKFDSINTSTLTTPDDSGTGNIGTVGTSSRLIAGRFGQALRFDNGGNGQFMTTKNNFGSPQWSISTWLNPDLPIVASSPYSGAYTFFSADQAPSGTSQMLLVTKDDVRTYGGSIGKYSFENNPGWHHVIVTYNGTSLTTYVDGTLRGSIPYTNILANSIKRYIGTNAGVARGHIFVGAIDETRLYNRVLTAAEITALFNNRANTVTATPRLATTTTTAPQVLAPALSTAPTTKITTSFTATTDKTVYKLGDTVRMSATVTLDPLWVTYLKSKGNTQAEVFFEIKDSTNKFLVQVPIAFDLVNTSVTRTYDWTIPASNTALAGKDFTVSVTVRDASKAVSEVKNVTGLSVENLPIVPVVSTITNVNNDGATVDESKVPAGTSPDIFAGVLASRDLLPSQFVITHIRNSNFATTTRSILPTTFRYTKNNSAENKARVRFTVPNRLNLSDYNVIDVVMENTLNTPIKITLQATDDSNSPNNFQAHYLLTANSGPRHLLLSLTRDLFKCNDVTGTDDCPASPRQAVLTSEYINGNPPNKSSISEIRVYADDMTEGSELTVHSMKAMNISYAPQYLKNYIDRYGQNNWVNFPEKITSDEQLKADARSERTTLRPLPDQWDMYGGDKTATGYGATGKFKVQKVDGKWWLVNPLGNLMYITSITQADYNDTTGYIGDVGSTKRGAYVELNRSGLLSNAFRDNFGCHGKSELFCGGTIWSPYISNIIKKYGTPSSTFAEITDRWRLNQSNRFREWGFNTVTARHGEYNIGWRTGVRDIPFIAHYNLKGKTTYQKVSGMDRVPDPFDPAFETEVNNIVIRHFRAGYPGTPMLVKDDPYAIGTTADNEIPWGFGEDRDLRNVYIVVLRILEQGSSQYSKVAFTNILKTKYNNDFGALRSAWGSALPSGINSWETFQNNPVVINGSISSNVREDLSLLLRKFADKFFIVTRTAIKREGGESHLYAGVRFANFYRAPREVIDSCAEYCDIITINYYNHTTADKREYWDYLLSKDKPVLITEFYFDSPSRGSAGTVKPETTTDQEQADAFKRYVRDVLTKPQIIGYAYHDMYDQPLLGSIWSENNLTGFVSETDRIYPKLVEAAKDINLDIYRLRGSRPNGNAPTTHSVTVGKIGAGSGTITGGTISCGSTCQNVFSIGSTVTLTATPTSGSTFVGWSGSCTGTGTCTLTMNSDKVVTAEFRVAPQAFTLNVAKVGNGTVTGTGIACGQDCTETVNIGTNITLTATPATGYTFTGWSGACTGTSTCTTSMIQDRTVTATFNVINTPPNAHGASYNTSGTTFDITLTASDAQGDTLTFTPSTLSTTLATLTRVREGIYRYTLRAPLPTVRSTDTFTFTASDGRLTSAPATVSIVFTPTPPTQFSLNTAVVGQGTVTGTGINCGVDCTERVNTGTSITLTATPAAGYRFSAWSGACTGTTCTVLVNTDKNVTATFTLIPPADGDQDGVPDTADRCRQTPANLRTQVNPAGCVRPRMTRFNIRPPVEGDLTAVNNVEIGIINIAKIRFEQPVTLGRTDGVIDLDTHVVIEKEKVEIKSAIVPELNKPSTITMYGVTKNNPRILKNGEDCTPPACNIQSYSNGVLVFTVTGFSVYTIDETPAVTPEPETPRRRSGGGGGGGGSGRTTTVAPADNATLIAQLTAQLNMLIAELNRLTGGSTVTGALTKTLSIGSRDPQVKTLQQLLNKKGIIVPTTGYFGAQTQAAVRKFQASKGINATGTVGPRTRAALNN